MRFFWAPPSHPLPPRPPVGWLRAIRETLGMTSAELGQRLAITASGLRKLQQAEAADAIRLATLRRVAEALDCELNYALVPRQPLRQMRRQQTLRLARANASKPWPGRSCAAAAPGCGIERRPCGRRDAP
jgi:predicted DNA-binding mobile mystery protein A